MLNLLKVAAFLIILLASLQFISSYDTSILADKSLTFKISLALIGGLFYTSFLTAPAATVVLIAVGQTTNIYLVAILGGIGAVAGDLLILKFFRFLFKKFSFAVHADTFRLWKKQLHRSHLDFIGYSLGLVIIASPFPDELGLALLGTSRLSYFKIAVLTFFANSIGILAVISAIRTIT